ncbi:hypothetical protein VNI00_003532 [Paramarasmius palmivorus]|uniref:F-box domain-containing protein n=1 Tax=Paramarasmius palmivorus TaxID=297713 RepID=A0AAW0DV89_9AGAR
MGASNSSLAASFQPSNSHGLKDWKLGIPPERASLPQVSSPNYTSTHQHRVHFDSKMANGNSRDTPNGPLTTKISRTSTISHHQNHSKSTWPNSKHSVVASVALLSEENLYALSKGQVPGYSTGVPGSRVYPTVSTAAARQAVPKPHAPPVLEKSQPQIPNTKPRLLPTSKCTDPVLKQHAPSRDEPTVPHQTTHVPTKSSSRSTLASSSRHSSTSASGEAASPGDVASSGSYLKTSRPSSSSGSRRMAQAGAVPVINEGNDITKGRRELKPIEEVDSAAGKQQLRSSVASQLPPRPPGLSTLAGTSTSPPLRSPTATCSSGHQAQTGELSQLLDKTSLDAPQASSRSQDQRRPSRTPNFLFILFLSDPSRLATLLQYLPFEDWHNLFQASSKVQQMISCNELLKEEVLERYLGDLGYSRWVWREPEPVMLSLSDLEYYIQSSTIPLREYAKIARQYLVSQTLPPSEQDPDIFVTVQRLANATRAYNRIVIRLRAQAERAESVAEDSSLSDTSSSSCSGPSSRRASYQSHSSGAHLHSHTASFLSGTSTSMPWNFGPITPNFYSPLYRRGRAALLRVFVPSPQGEWLSDASVLECETELKRAGLLGAMKLGDVVLDVAVGDEGSNVGKLIWDGWYLLDLDYSYSAAGDIPKHIPSLALPPSYYHRVISTGPLNVDPIVRIDVSPWGHEIARNLQLMQDKMVVETSQGQLQNAVKWVHRSTFVIRPPLFRSNTLQSKRSTSAARSRSGSGPGVIPISTSNGGHTVHPSWYGAVIIETDSSNESLEDLKERCGLSVFPKKVTSSRKQKDNCSRMVWRILRDKSHPGEIWIRPVGSRERLM